MRHRLVKHLPSAARVWTRRFIDDQRGAVAMTYAICGLIMFIALGTGMDLSNALQVRYRLDLAADASAVACGETWQAYMEAGAGTATTDATFTTLQNDANAAAKAQGIASFNAQASSLGATLSTGYPTVTTTDGEQVANGIGSASVACAVAYKAYNPNYLMQLAGIGGLNVTGGATTNVTIAPYVEVFLVLDTSASMMVGSTPTDQAKVAAYVAAYDTAPATFVGTVSNPTNPSTCMVFSSCANLPLAPDWLNNYAYPGNGTGIFAGIQAAPNHDITPCAFACHEDTSATFHVSDMQQGEAVAAAVGATTRFDVMKQALVNDPETQSTSYCGGAGEIACVHTCAVGTQPSCNPDYQGLLPYIRDTYLVTNARAALNTFSYTTYGFNWGIDGDEPPATAFAQDDTDYSQYSVVNQTALPNVAAAINKLTIGLDTHLNPPVNTGHTAVLPHLASLVGTTSTSSTPGTTSANPLKFVIIMTDGLNSDRNWNCGPNNCAYAPDPIPTTITQEPSIAAATYCSEWNTIPSVDGVPLWQGKGTNGNTGQCNNNAYNPGFLLGNPSPTVSSKVGANTYSGASPYDVTSKNGTASTDQLNYNLVGNNAVWYAGPIETSYCTTMRQNGGVLDHPVNGNYPGVVIAVLETPYVPMTGQDPIYYPYEGSVQAVIWPLGDPVSHSYPTYTPPGSTTPVPMSALSQALQTCASPGGNYYFQATSDSDIATGFKTLFQNYVGAYVHITQ